MKLKNYYKTLKDKRKEIHYTKYLLILLLSFTFSLSTVNAQETVPVAGGNAGGTGGSVSYTIGQTFYLTNTGSNGSVAEGVQQPFEISVVIGIEEANGISLQCSVYPNPATDFLILKVDNFNLSAMMFQLYDSGGKNIKAGNIESNETTISMNDLVSGTYFLKVNQSNQEIKIFKIIKW